MKSSYPGNDISEKLEELTEEYSKLLSLLGDAVPVTMLDPSSTTKWCVFYFKEKFYPERYPQILERRKLQKR